MARSPSTPAIYGRETYNDIYFVSSRCLLRSLLKPSG